MTRLPLYAAIAALALAAAAFRFTTPAPVKVKSPLAPVTCHEYAKDPVTLKCLRPGKVVVWGDSMAWGWTAAVTRKHGDVVQLTRDSCAPLLNLRGEFPAEQKCRVFAKRAVEAVQSFETVYLVGKWRSNPLTLGDTLALVAPNVREVVVIGPTPEMQRDPVTRAEFDADAAVMLNAMREAAKPYPNVRVIDVTDQFCTATECPRSLDGVSLYSDDFHVSAEKGARLTLN